MRKPPTAARSEFRLPPRDSAAGMLRELSVRDRDATEILAAWPSPRDAEVWRLLERAYVALTAETVERDDWSPMPPELGATGRYFYVYVFLAALAGVRAFHRSRGIPDDVSAATLADLGRNLARDRELYGEGGLRTFYWLTLHFSGAIYELGRLQFNRMQLRPAHLGPAESAAGMREGDAALGVHIPEGGSLSSAECDASFARAARFFPEHFPETPTRLAVCTSWLLDPQLAEYLPADSNIVRFQRRFTLVGGYDGDADILRFVFKRLEPPVEELPQRTSLERAYVEHLRAGRHWETRTGWLEL